MNGHWTGLIRSPFLKAAQRRARRAILSMYGICDSKLLFILLDPTVAHIVVSSSSLIIPTIRKNRMAQCHTKTFCVTFSVNYSPLSINWYRTDCVPSGMHTFVVNISIVINTAWQLAYGHMHPSTDSRRTWVYHQLPNRHWAVVIGYRRHLPTRRFALGRAR